MNGYTKLFGSIIASTIWREDNETRVVWITLLAMSDRHGYVAASLPGLSDLARVSIEHTERAIEKLSSPDKYSRSREHDGRRIQQVDGGWLILNHGKYREKMSADDRREYLRIKQQEWRDRNKEKNRNPPKEKESRFVVPTIPEMKLHAAKIGLPESEVDKFFNYYESNGWKVGRNKMKSWRHAMVNWRNNRDARIGDKRSGTKGDQLKDAL